MEIKPVVENKMLLYPLVTAVVAGTVALSGCQQQQQQPQGEAPPQILGGVMK